MEDEKLIALATDELEKLSLIKKDSSLEGYVSGCQSLSSI